MEKKSEPVKKDQKTAQTSVGKTVGAVLGITVGIIVIGIAGVAIALYQGNQKNEFVNDVASVIPYPAAKVNGSFISYSDYRNNVDALSKYFMAERDTDLTKEENSDVLVQVQQTILSRMVEDIVVEEIAKDFDVVVTDEDLDVEFEKVKAELGSDEEVEKTLDELYGWTVEEFKENVLRKQLQKDKVQQAYQENEDLTSEEKAEAEDVLARVQNGEDFAELAKEFSDDLQSAQDGGNLGTVEFGFFVPEFEDAIRSLEPGQVSGVVESQFGFHIIRLESKTDTEFTSSHILISTDFEQYLADKIRDAKVSIYLDGFDWVEDEGQIEITDTDGDGMKDEDDEDDDNDGFSDSEEDEAGSDAKTKASTPDSLQESDLVVPGTESTEVEGEETPQE